MFTGGALGTGLRAVILWSSHEGPLSLWAMPLINVVGAAALGWLTATLAGRSATKRSAHIRVFFGTGVLGGFTTYSALATFSASHGGILPGAVTAVAGLLAAMAGLWLGGRERGRS